MSFKTLDGVTVYDKRDVDAIKEDIDSRMLDRQELETALNTKVSKSEVTALVNQSIDTMINSKLAVIESDINHIVNNTVEQELHSYDDSNTVDQKISTAVAAIPNPGVASSADVNAIVNQYF